MLVNVQALLPEDPLKDPRGDFAGTLGSWVLEEAVAAYTGTAPSLQAALDIYKRNFFLAVTKNAASWVWCTNACSDVPQTN